MDPQNIEVIRMEIAANAHTVESLTIVMRCLLVAIGAWMIVAMWRRAQYDQAERRVRDRLAQERDPEGWARRQAQQAQEVALIADELARIRRAAWYGRLWSWWRPGRN